MTDATLDGDREAAGSARLSKSRIATPLAALILFLVILAIASMLPIIIPIGPMYWDLFLYFDAANRILDGQIPVIDFFTPVGPLGYYLFTGAVSIFPNAQPLLLVSWSLLAVTAPLMALTIRHVDRRSRALAFALLLPFLFFTVLPFNGQDYYPYPGSDGFGIYNRQVCQLLYCLATALVFVRARRLLAMLIALSMLALFFVKITGFIAGGLLCLFAFAAGRIGLKYAIAAAVGFLAVLVILELGLGLVSAYIADIIALVDLNTGSLLPRMLQAASHNFGVIFPGALLCCLLVLRDRRDLLQGLKTASRQPPFRNRQLSALAHFVDHQAFWLGTCMFAGLLFESQNTGSQAMIFLWPVILVILLDAAKPEASRAGFVAVTVLALATALPVAVNIGERAARAWVGALVNNVRLEHENLKTLGAVNFRPVIDTRAERLLAIYPEHRETYEALTASGELPSFLQFSDLDFQVNWLRTTDRAVSAIREYEAREDVRFNTILLMDFANPFPWLMDRSGVKHITIGADPFRAVPPPTPDVRQAVAEADLALYPTCPPTVSNDKLRRLYAPMLTNHRRITLTPCFDAYVRNDLGTAASRN